MARDSDTAVGIRAIPRTSLDAPVSEGALDAIYLDPVTDIRCPFCNIKFPLEAHPPLKYVTCGTCGKQVLAPGRLGTFLLHDHIGDGEMGSIYRATDESLEREVAIKVVRLGQADEPGSRERLAREACAAGKLNHPRVAQVYALNFANGHPYLVMELVSGQDLARIFDSEGPLAERSLLRMALDVAEGLSALYREGLVHGDIKPANIVLDRDGNAKLVDFGLSGMKRQDSQGNFIGTPFFIAPELLRGLPDTHQSDLYSLGATLYYLLSGHLTHEGDTPAELLKARVSEAPVPLEKRLLHPSQATCRLIMRLIDSSPTKRPANSEVVAAEIRDALALLDSTPQPVSAALFTRICRIILRMRLPRLPRRQAHVRRRRYVFDTLLIVALCASLIGFVIVHPSCEKGRANILEFLERHHVTHDGLTTWWQDARTRIGAWTRGHAKKPIERPVIDPDPHVVFTLANGGTWFTMPLGTEPQRGSVMHISGTLVLQGAGAGMWEGKDNCRYVWTGAAGSYECSAMLLAYAAQDPLAMTGLLIKGDDPEQGDGLFFGVLGNGDLALQLRLENGGRPVIKREPPRTSPWRYLGIARSGDTFTARISDDGQTWQDIATCSLSLPDDTSVGFVVTPHAVHTLATAKFAHIRLVKNTAP